MRTFRALILMLALLIVPQLAGAQTFPPLSGRVVDAANLLSPAQKQQLEALSTDVGKVAQRQFVVATIPDLQSYPIEDYGYKLGRAWGIGQKDANNGIILIVAPNERKVRIEVGYGLEPIMTDALSQTIIDDQILPKFRSGDMAGGIVAGAQAIAEQMKAPPEAAEARVKAAAAEPQAARSSGSSSDGFIAIFWIVIVLFFVLPIIFRGARGRKYRGGRGPVVLWGPGLGGGWGSGGGSSSSSWSSGSSGSSDWGGGGGRLFGRRRVVRRRRRVGELVMRGPILTPAEREQVTQAVIAAEAGTDAEIVTIVAPRSDPYHDIGLNLGIVAMLLVAGIAALNPTAIEDKIAWFQNGWQGGVNLGRSFFALMVVEAIVFLLVRGALYWSPLRLALTPKAVRSRRVRRRAIQYFKVGAERRTAARIGVLLYLSLDERLAEIVADEAIHAKVPPERWGAAMAALIDRVRAGHPGDGMTAAVTAIGTIVAEHFPKTESDVNELPDRLIEL